MAITCLHMEMLIHAHTRPDHYYLNTKGKQEYAQYLQSQGLLTITVQPPHTKSAYLKLTGKGEFFLKAMLSLPFPIPTTTWSIPRSKEGV